MAVDRGCIQSRVCPWLSAIAYPLGSRAVLPQYFGQIEVRGQENLPTSGPVIIAPVHRSRWDALIVPHVTGPQATGRYLRFMVSANEVKGLQGWFIRRLGGFPVNPQRPGVKSLRYGIELLKQGEMLVIFPEGAIFRDRAVHSLKTGLARLAIQAETNQPGLGTQIVPIYLAYSQSMPGWGARVQLNIGKPLDVTQYITGSAKQDAKTLTADLRKHLVHLGEEMLGTSLDAEVEPDGHIEELAQGT